jgi:hypothetical protein
MVSLEDCMYLALLSSWNWVSTCLQCEGVRKIP